MSSELTALMSHGTWDLIPPPKDCKPVGCKWVFRIKRKVDGSVDKFKARLVAKGYNLFIYWMEHHQRIALSIGVLLAAYNTSP